MGALTHNDSYWNTSNANLTITVCQANVAPLHICLILTFALIFFVSVVGNCLVIVTIIQNRRMRTVTNMFLLNLAVSDLLLIVICMPPTLTALTFKCFFFGPFMCRVLSYLQPLSVSGSSNTLVVIALERFFAICRPLQSRRWQTKSHCAKMITASWLLAMVEAFPYFVVSKLDQYTTGMYNCVQNWPTQTFFRVYWLLLVFMLFIGPLIFMILLYSLVISNLWQGIRVDQHSQAVNDSDLSPRHLGTGLSRQRSADSRRSTKSASDPKNPISLLRSTFRGLARLLVVQSTPAESNDNTARRAAVSRLRSTHNEQNLMAKKRVIRMLAAIVVEFFVCWIPLYILVSLNYFGLINLNRHFNYFCAFLVLAYSSSLTNPITYCFMNRRFRQAFLIAFGCRNFAGTMDRNGTMCYTTAPTQIAKARSPQRKMEYEMRKPVSPMSENDTFESSKPLMTKVVIVESSNSLSSGAKSA